MSDKKRDTAANLIEKSFMFIGVSIDEYRKDEADAMTESAKQLLSKLLNSAKCTEHFTATKLMAQNAKHHKELSSEADMSQKGIFDDALEESLNIAKRNRNK